MKLQEQLKEIKRLMTEATSSSNAGSYEAPLPVDAPEELETIVSVEIMDDAPEVDVVDITMGDDMDLCPNCGEPECPGCEDEYMDEDQTMDLEDVFNSLGLFTETTIKEDEMDTLEKEQSEDSRIHTDLNARIDDLDSRVSKLEKTNPKK